MAVRDEWDGAAERFISLQKFFYLWLLSICFYAQKGPVATVSSIENAAQIV
jgi:hypothetical protein